MARLAPVRVEVKMMEFLVVQETIAALTAERDAARAELSELRARVEAAVGHITGRKFDLGSVTWISDYMEDLLAILAPPEAPTEADRKGNNDE